MPSRQRYRLLASRALLGPRIRRMFRSRLPLAAICVVTALNFQQSIAEPGAGSSTWDTALMDGIKAEVRRQAAQAQLRRESIRTLDDLNSYCAHVRQGLLHALFEQEALPIAKQPLRTSAIGAPIALPECTLTKVCYESIPGHWVTASLYLPHNVTYPVPGILCIADHSPEGKAAPYNQRQGRAFAERGYVALVIDYPDRGELRGGNDHFINGAQVGLTGLWSNALFVANAVHGVDYLISRSDLVDPARIGVTGTSGGGATTAMVAALDQRVVAAVPCCFLETFERAIQTEYTSCPEYFAPGGISWPMEWSDVLTVAIPRAVAPVTALHDSLFTQSGFDQSAGQLTKFYALANQSERLRIVRTREQHAYTPAMREAAFYWFARWLGRPRGEHLPEWPDRVREANDVELTLGDDRLDLVPAERLTVAKPSETNLHTLARKRGERLRSEKFDFRSDGFSQTQARDICSRVKAFFPPAEDCDDLEVVTLAVQTTERATLEDLIIKSAQGRVQLPARWARPAPHSPRQLLLYLHEGGRAALGAEAMDAYLNQEIAVLAVDLRGFGQLYPRASPWDKYPWCDISRLSTYALWSLNSSVPHLQVADARVALQFMRTQPDFADVPIYILGVGRAAPIALFTTAMHAEIAGLAGRGSLVSYQDYLEHESPTYNQMGLAYGVLKEFDLPVVLAAVADRLISWSNVVDANGEQLSDGQLRDQLRLPVALARRSASICTIRSEEEIAQLLRREQR